MKVMTLSLSSDSQLQPTTGINGARYSRGRYMMQLVKIRKPGGMK